MLHLENELLLTEIVPFLQLTILCPVRVLNFASFFYFLFIYFFYAVF